MYAPDGDLEYINPRVEYEGTVDPRKVRGCDPEIWRRRNLHHFPVRINDSSPPLKFGDTRFLYPIALYGLCCGEEGKEPVFENGNCHLRHLVGLTESIEEIHPDAGVLMLECLPQEAANGFCWHCSAGEHAIDLGPLKLRLTEEDL